MEAALKQEAVAGVGAGLLRGRGLPAQGQGRWGGRPVGKGKWGQVGVKAWPKATGGEEEEGEEEGEGEGEAGKRCWILLLCMGRWKRRTRLLRRGTRPLFSKVLYFHTINNK